MSDDPYAPEAPAVQTEERPVTGRAWPASLEAEEHVIACCLLEGDEGASLARACNAGLTPDSFYFPATRVTFEALLDMRERGLPLTDATLIAEAGERIPGGLPWIVQVTGKIPTTAHAAYFIGKVREKELLRRAIREATRTVEEAHAFTGGLDEFLQTAEARMEAVRAASGTQAVRSVAAAKALAARRVHAAAPPAEPVTRLYLAKKPIATPGNLVTLISRAKTGKTAVLGAATAAIIAAHHDRPSQDTLGFTAPHTQDAVIVIDTEQSPYDAYLCYRRSLDRAGQTDDPKWLYHYSLVGYTPEQVKEAILLALQTAGRVFTLILDGVADLVNSVNDEAECNGLVTWLRGLAVQYDCPILCVIHSNESIKSGDDGRGHLGKQLIRKAESNLLLKKQGEVTTITSDKQRKAPITEKDGISFQWSDEHQRHVSCKPEATEKRGRPAYDFDQFTSIFPRSDQPPASRPVLFRFAADMSDIKETAFRDLLHRAVQNGQLDRVADGHGFKYRLPRV